MRRLLFLLVLVPALFAQPSTCPAPKPGPSWNGWGNDATNARFQPAASAQLTAAQVPNLKLKWAFGFPGTRSVLGQPTVVGGRVFISIENGTVYALDANTGCQFWAFKADSGVRGVTVDAGVVFFGDNKANAYAVDVNSGMQIWKTQIETHASARITGIPKVFEGKVYVPVASGEEGAGGNVNYSCCTFRGSVVALNVADGKQVWKTYTIPEAPVSTGKNTNGVQRFAPAGGGVWNSPTIDPKRRVLYVGTGDAYTEPAAKTTDSIMAIGLDKGEIVWSVQDTENDVWLSACTATQHGENCPKTVGPDHDFGSPPMLKTLTDGKQILVAGQKSGNVWAHDPDNKGKVLWRTALVADTTQFGGKIVWGGAADDANAYFGLGPGGIGAVQLKDGERKWLTDLKPAQAVATHTGQDGPLTAIPGVVFSGGWDGVLRALSSADGHVIWEYNTVQDATTVNGVAAKGGSMGAPGPVVAGGMVYVPSGYVGVKNGLPGNVLLVFAPTER